MELSPRALLKNVQKDLAKDDIIQKIISVDDSKNVIRGFINFESASSKNYKEILENPVFKGCGPHVVDQVFFLEKYSCDHNSNITASVDLKSRKEAASASTIGNKNKTKLSAVGSTHSEPQYVPYTAVQKVLIGINIFLFIGLVLFVLSVAAIALIVSNDQIAN